MVAKVFENFSPRAAPIIRPGLSNEKNFHIRVYDDFASYLDSSQIPRYILILFAYRVLMPYLPLVGEILPKKFTHVYRQPAQDRTFPEPELQTAKIHRVTACV